MQWRAILTEEIIIEGNVNKGIGVIVVSATETGTKWKDMEREPDKEGKIRYDKNGAQTR